MKFNTKTMIILIAILAILTVFNIASIAYIDYTATQPQSSYTITTMGAAFKSPTEPNVIELNLIRPPREVVYPGEIAYSDAKITNTADFETYLRATYRVDVKDASGKVIPEYNSWVDVMIGDGWYCQDGYWYYYTPVQPGESVPGPIKAIEYSANFANFLDSQVYVPVLIESVEAAGNEISEIEYWPNQNIQKVDYENLEKEISWTTKVVIE